jgi:hypothetical protein
MASSEFRTSSKVRVINPNIINFFSEILIEERQCDTDTMRRENRRVAAMSWGAGDDAAPPKPARVPMMGEPIANILALPKPIIIKITHSHFADSNSLLSLGGGPVNDGGGHEPMDMGVAQTYIIAQNPAVLAQLMRENERRGVNPSAYTTPASVFNTLAVVFDNSTSSSTTSTTTDPTNNPHMSGAALSSVGPATDPSDLTKSNSSELAFKTVKLPANEILKLDPINEPIRLRPSCEVSSIVDSLNKSQIVDTVVDEFTCTTSTTSSTTTCTSAISNSITTSTTTTSTVDTLERYKNPQDAILLNQTQNLSQTVSAAVPFPQPCEIINALTQNTHSLDPVYKSLQQGAVKSPEEMWAKSQGSPFYAGTPQQYFSQQPASVPYQYQPAQQSPQPVDSKKSRSLERNMGQNMVLSYAARINSLERAKQMEYGMVTSSPAGPAKAMRSNSLTRQTSDGSSQPIYVKSGFRSTSLERSEASMPPSGMFGSKNGSLDRKSQANPLFATCSPAAVAKGGSLERNQSTMIVNEMLKRGVSPAGIYRGGSLERNPTATMMGVMRSSSLERNTPYHAYKSQMQVKEQEPAFQEEIYDFGGVNVKSCASIAMKKSVEKGILPASYMQQQQMAAYRASSPSAQPKMWQQMQPKPFGNTVSVAHPMVPHQPPPGPAPPSPHFYPGQTPLTFHQQLQQQQQAQLLFNQKLTNAMQLQALNQQAMTQSQTQAQMFNIGAQV